MKTLKTSDYKMLEQLVSLKQPALKKAMQNFLRAKYKDIVVTADYIYAKGDIPIALVAHMDTVFPHPPIDVYYDQRKNVIWSPQGLGADDRAGVFSILQIVQSGLRPCIILTTNEEIGCIGASKLAEQEEICPFPGLKYIIELDRQGSDDCVFYECFNPKFVDYIESFGFVEAFGSYSDICAFCPDWGIAGVNLSIGYRNEHTIAETLHVGAMLNTIEKVKRMLQAKDVPEFIYIPDKNYAFTSRWYSDVLKRFDVQCYQCYHCKQPFSDYEMFPVKGLDRKTHFYCPDCIASNIEWCDKCQEAFEIDPLDPKSKLCKDCQGGTSECTTSSKYKESSTKLSNTPKESKSQKPTPSSTNG